MSNTTVIGLVLLGLIFGIGLILYLQNKRAIKANAKLESLRAKLSTQEESTHEAQIKFDEASQDFRKKYADRVARARADRERFRGNN